MASAAVLLVAMATVRLGSGSDTDAPLPAMLVRCDGDGASRVGVLVGPVAVLVTGCIGNDMAAIGEAAFDDTGRVPQEVLFGAAGSAKLAHAAGPHGIQLLALLAILCDARRLRARGAGAVPALAALGCAAVLGAVTATAYVGRPPAVRPHGPQVDPAGGRRSHDGHGGHRHPRPGIPHPPDLASRSVGRKTPLAERTGQ